MALQDARREHGDQVEEQVWLLLELARQRLFEGLLKDMHGMGRHSIPALGLTPMMVVDCRATAQIGKSLHTFMMRQHCQDAPDNGGSGRLRRKNYKNQHQHADQ